MCLGAAILHERIITEAELDERMRTDSGDHRFISELLTMFMAAPMLAKAGIPGMEPYLEGYRAVNWHGVDIEPQYVEYWRLPEVDAYERARADALRYHDADVLRRFVKWLRDRYWKVHQPQNPAYPFRTPAEVDREFKQLMARFVPDPERAARPKKSRRRLARPNTQVTPILLGILKAARTPRSRDELKGAVGLGDFNHFRKEHLEPLLVAGLLVMTIPEKPRSRRQRYVTTPAGEIVLDQNSSNAG